MQKRLLALFSSFIMLIFLVACSNTNYIATVNDEKIDEAYFKYYFTEWKNMMQLQHGEDTWQDAALDGKPALEYVRERAFQAVVEDKIIMMKAKADNIQLTDVDNKNIASIKEQWISQYGSEEEFLKAIKGNYSLSEEQFDYMVQAVFYRENLIDKYVTVSDSQIKQYYNDNIAKVKHILIPTVDLGTGVPLSEEEIESAKVTINEIQGKIDNGDDFDSLVSEYTKDQDAFYYVGNGYSLIEDGSQSTGMVPEFEEMSLILNVGEVGAVVESTYGYHIIKRYENDNDMYEKSKQTLSHIMKTVEFSDVLEKWKSEMKIVLNDELYNSYE